MPQKTPQATDASKKRSVARRFNDALAGLTPKAKVTDQRVQRRLKRYEEELKSNKTKGGGPLTPLDVAMRVNELLGHGHSVAALRKIRPPRESDYDRDAMVTLLKEMHPVYGYRPTAYRFAGVDDETLLAAGIIEKLPAKRGPKKKN